MVEAAALNTIYFGWSVCLIKGLVGWLTNWPLGKHAVAGEGMVGWVEPMHKAVLCEQGFLELHLCVQFLPCLCCLVAAAVEAEAASLGGVELVAAA